MDDLQRISLSERPVEGVALRRKIETVWSAWEILAPDETESQGAPALACTPDGTLHCVWEQQDASGDYQIWHSRNAGDGWSTPANVSGISGYAQREPALAAGADGSLHCVWRGRDEGNAYTDAIKYAAWDGAAWGGWEAVHATLPAPQGRADLAVDDAGAVHVAWWCMDEPGIRYNVRDASGWGTAAFVADTQGVWAYMPAIAILAGVVHVVCEGEWGGGGAWELLAHASFDGAAWSAWDVLHDPGADQILPDLVAGQDGLLHLLWQGWPDDQAAASQIWHATWDGAWGAAACAHTGLDGYTQKTVRGVAAAGGLHAVWAGFDAEHGLEQVRHARLGQAWEPWEIIQEVDGYQQMSPAACLDATGHVQAVWSGKDAGDGGQAYWIKHSGYRVTALEPGITYTDPGEDVAILGPYTTGCAPGRQCYDVPLQRALHGTLVRVSLQAQATILGRYHRREDGGVRVTFDGGQVGVLYGTSEPAVQTCTGGDGSTAIRCASSQPDAFIGAVTSDGVEALAQPCSWFMAWDHRSPDADVSADTQELVTFTRILAGVGVTGDTPGNPNGLWTEHWAGFYVRYTSLNSAGKFYWFLTLTMRDYLFDGGDRSTTFDLNMLPSDARLVDGQWHSYRLWFDNAGAHPVVTLYVDGVLEFEYEDTRVGPWQYPLDDLRAILGAILPTNYTDQVYELDNLEIGAL
jgi:hypothetical protein